VVGSPDLEDVARQADEIIQRARDEAARIDTEARARASTPSSAAPAIASESDRAAVKAFLAQEKAFLESLAGLVQGHAESVKGMVRNARRPDQGVESTAAPDTEAVSTEPAVDEPPPPPAGVRPSEPDGGGVGDRPARLDPDHDPIAHVQSGRPPQVLDRPGQVARDTLATKLGRDLQLERDGDPALARDPPSRHHRLRELDLVGLERDRKAVV